jgi:hypothetical protein
MGWTKAEEKGTRGLFFLSLRPDPLDRSLVRAVSQEKLTENPLLKTPYKL